ncbi:MAG: hypothetical protein V4733_12330 [Verrucomicrobiota bacterium]
MKQPLLSLISLLVTALTCGVAIKPAAPRRPGLGPAPATPPVAPAKADVKKPSVAPAKPADPRTPSANLLKDLAIVEKIHAEPSRAAETITRCGNLRNPLATYPGHFQKLHFFWAVALANAGDMNEASQKFAIVSAATAPDQALAIRALNEQIRFLLRAPDTVEKTIDLVSDIVSRTRENSPQQMTALFHGACGLFILERADQAIAILDKISGPLGSAKDDAGLALLRKSTSNLLSALHAAKAARNPGNPPHVFYAPWRGVESTGNIGMQRRIADLALALRDFPRALALYTALEKDAEQSSQSEIRAWSRMQRARILCITGKPGESEKLLDSFLTVSPYKDAKCAPFAVLRLALLYHNYRKDIPKAIKAFETGASRFRGTPEAAQSQYYRAMIPQLQNKPKDALPLLIAYAEAYPKHPQTTYLKVQLIPAIEKQLLAGKAPASSLPRTGLKTPMHPAAPASAPSAGPASGSPFGTPVAPAAR